MPHKQTLLEELVADRTRYTLGATAVRDVDLLAERFANALLKDPVIRARLATLVEQQIGPARRGTPAQWTAREQEVIRRPARRARTRRTGSALATAYASKETL